MFATMLVAAVIAAVYCVLVARHLAAAHRDADAASPFPPAGFSADASTEAEIAAVRALLTGDLSRAAYRATMASLAADAHLGHPLTVPE